MGIAIEHPELAQHQTFMFDEDWYRFDTSTDTDGDMMPDYWEVQNQLNRSWSSVTGTTNSEQNLDPDGDGLANLQEYQNGGDAQNPDTDGDCIMMVMRCCGLGNKPSMLISLCKPQMQTWTGFRTMKPSRAR